MEFKLATSMVQLSQTYNILKQLGDYYPDFHYWFYNKVVPGVNLNKDKVILGYSRNKLVGVSIIKDDNSEKKLRALRIAPEFQKNGYGLYLMDKSLELLKTDKPLLSVSQDMLHDFSRLFIERYEFDLTRVHKNLYKKGKLEYQFNGEKDSLVKSGLPY